MVLFSKVVITNLSDILTGLVGWKKHPLEVEHAMKYVSEIRRVCETLETKTFHFNVLYSSHKRFGEKVHTWRRNKNTIYILYTILTTIEMFIYSG